jgi:hypothetical protein
MLQNRQRILQLLAFVLGSKSSLSLRIRCRHGLPLAFTRLSTGRPILNSRRTKSTCRLNIGNSPATNIDIQPMIFFNYLQNGMTTYADTLRKEQEDWCRGFARQKPSPTTAITLFPSDPFTRIEGLTGPIRDEAVIHDKESGNMYTSAIIVVCVNYSGIEGSRYHTQGRWAVLDMGRQTHLLELGTDLNPPRLRFDHDDVADRAN